MTKLNYATPEEFAAEVAALDARIEANQKRIRVDTPWGPAQHVERRSDTIAFYGTASHGGFYVSDVSLALIPAEWRAFAKKWSGSENWFEEDCAWFAVALTFTWLFTREELEAARRTFAHVTL